MRNSSIADRDPCPYRIIEDIGGAFAFGAIGGGVWHFGKGAWNSPKGWFFLKFIVYPNLVTCHGVVQVIIIFLIHGHRNPLIGFNQIYSLIFYLLKYSSTNRRISSYWSHIEYCCTCPYNGRSICRMGRAFCLLRLLYLSNKTKRRPMEFHCLGCCHWRYISCKSRSKSNG